MSRIPKKRIYLEEKQKKNDEIEKLYEDSETRVIRINKRIIIEEKSKKDIELTEESKHPSKMITVVDEDIEIIKEIKPKRINETDIKIEKHQEDISNNCRRFKVQRMKSKIKLCSPSRWRSRIIYYYSILTINITYYSITNSFCESIIRYCLKF